jgi:hypothetical protein
MIQYRLIKKYPGSEKLGNIEWFNRDVLGKNGCSNDWKGRVFYDSHPEFWQKVEELDYEILQFFNKMNNRVYGRVYCGGKASIKLSSIDKFHENVDYEYCLRYYAIHSVKRLSDGVVFTIGDNIDSLYNNPITSIYITKKPFQIKGIWFEYKDGSCSLLMARKVEKTPLFTTEDGEEIFEGEHFFYPNTHTWEVQKADATKKMLEYVKDVNHYRTFSTKEKAFEYVLRNKPCLSINEIGSNIPEGTLLRLLETVNSKL